MGKAGRFACIITPMALTFASLICILLVGLGGTNKNDHNLNNLYFFRADTSNVTSSLSVDLPIPDSSIANNLIGQGLKDAEGKVSLKDFYTVALWGYCDGSKGNSSNGNASQVDFCSKPVSEFYFNFIDVWGLNNTVAKDFPKELQGALNTYKTVSKWMYIAYVIAFVATCVELVVGFFAIFSRWGSFATTIASGVSSLFILAASATATALFLSLEGTVNTVFKAYGIHGSLGHSIFVTTWLAVAFSWAAGLFWVFSTCCCSGRSNNSHRNGARGDKGPYNYERVASPYMSHPGNATGPAGHNPAMYKAPGPASAYEPYRQTYV